jgi:hypothetical protein
MVFFVLRLAIKAGRRPMRPKADLSGFANARGPQ